VHPDLWQGRHSPSVTLPQLRRTVPYVPQGKSEMNYELCKHSLAMYRDLDLSLPDRLRIQWNSNAGPYHNLMRVEVSFPQWVLNLNCSSFEWFINPMYSLRAIADSHVHTIVINIHDAPAFEGDTASQTVPNILGTRTLGSRYRVRTEYTDIVYFTRILNYIFCLRLHVALWKERLPLWSDYVGLPY
jgi:hypothetical protein